MRFLINECLTLDLVSVATRAGYEAQHVAHAGKAGWKDWNVAEYASDGDFIVVTNNASDFRRLYAKQPIHAGLVIIIPNVKRLEQQRLFGLVVEELATLGDPVNRVLELEIGGAEIRFSLYDLP
jgi:predicted nuclease of predicted toxin-antitoxin system